MSGNFTRANSNAIALGTSVNMPGTNDEMYIDAWIKIRTNNDQRIISKSVGFGGQTFELSLDTSSRLKFVIGGDFLAGSAIVPLDTWSYVSGNYTGSVMALYIDGVLDTTRASSGNVPSNAEPCRIASAGHSSVDRNFDGLIYRVRLFNRKLDSGDEIISVANLNGGDELVSAYEWKFTEGPPGVSIGAGVIVNSGNFNLANGSGEGSPLPTWDDQDLMLDQGAA